MAEAVLALGRADALRARDGVVGSLELVGEERRSAAVGELVVESSRWWRSGAEHVLDALQEGLVLVVALVGVRQVELLEVEDHVREVLDRAVEEVVARRGSREPRR